MEDISQYAVPPESYDPLAKHLIGNFFTAHPSITKDDCDREAAKLVGAPVSPTLVQGGASYTVAADDPSQYPKVIQFRKTALDLELVSRARQVYGALVPNCEARGMLADVFIYEMDLVPGVAFCRARRQLLAPAMEQRLLQTVEDFARFFALAWIKKSAVEQQLDTPGTARSDLSAHYSRVLDKLSQALPARFQQKLDDVRRGLPLLFRPDYPMVVHNDELEEENIFVDEATGSITGVVGWAGPKIAPFGISLWGLETLLGVRTSTSWHFHPNHEHLRAQFWKAFYGVVGDISEDDRQAIEVARVFGLFRHYGFDRQPEMDNAVPLKEGDRDFLHLETFCLR